MENSSMKRLSYPLFLVMLSLTSAVFFTTVTAVTLASYSKAEKSGSAISAFKEQVIGEGSTVNR